MFFKALGFTYDIRSWNVNAGAVFTNMIQNTPANSTLRGYFSYPTPLYDEFTGTRLGDICFLGDTKVDTDQGKIRFDKLTTKNTINGNKIKQIIRVINADDNMIFIKKHSLGYNIPNQNTYISRNHGIILQDVHAIKNNLINLVRARELINNQTITEIMRKNDLLYNVLLEKYSYMIINNMMCETLNPNDPKSKKYIK